MFFFYTRPKHAIKQNAYTDSTEVVRFLYLVTSRYDGAGKEGLYVCSLLTFNASFAHWPA